MTRRIVYGVGLILTIACKTDHIILRLQRLTCAGTVMTIGSIASPRWVSYSPVRLDTPSPPSSPHTNNTQDGKREWSYGLHSRCTADGTCVPFPKTSDCAKDPSFCNMWRTVGFLISFAVVMQLCTLVSFVVIIGGGVQRRVAGWQVASGVLLFSAVVQCAGMAIVVCSLTLIRACAKLHATYQTPN
jgi:hypothetical protein